MRSPAPRARWDRGPRTICRRPRLHRLRTLVIDEFSIRLLAPRRHLRDRPRRRNRGSELLQAQERSPFTPRRPNPLPPSCSVRRTCSSARSAPLTAASPRSRPCRPSRRCVVPEVRRTGLVRLPDTAFPFAHLVPRSCSFTAANVCRVWELGCAPVLRTTSAADADRAVYDYVIERGSAGGWEPRLFGVSPRAWVFRRASSGGRAQLPDRRAALRRARRSSPVARGHPAAPAEDRLPHGQPRKRDGLLRRPSGIELLRGHASGHCVILAEGLTDFLALATYSATPCSAPGTGMARRRSARGCEGLSLFLALDVDVAGQHAIDAVASAALAIRN